MLLRYDRGKEDEEEEGEEVEEWDEYEDDASDLSDIQYSLFTELEDVDEASLWAFYGPIPQGIPMPALCLSQNGVVGLPLSSMDALRIKQHATQFGSENSPIVDDNDLSCDLDPPQLELQNPLWKTTAELIGMEAAKPFGISPATVHFAQIDVVRPNPDPAALGSLMIVLPSLHAGGDIKLTFGNETQQFSTAITSEFGYSFVAWFSDVRLELDPIVSGYRLHVMYDLYSPMTQLGVNPSASWLSGKATTYQSMLKQWSRLREDVGNASPIVAFILEGEERNYEHERLSYGRLNENHTYKAVFLQQQCIKSNVCFWLARMSSSVDGIGYGTSESIFKLDRISEIDGTEVVEGSVLIDKKDVVHIDSFKHRDGNDNDYAKQDSESEGTIRHFKDWVFLLLPESQRMQFLAENMKEGDRRTFAAIELKYGKDILIEGQVYDKEMDNLD